MKHHDIVVFYHKDCFDGFGAAYAAWKKFKDKAAYVGLGRKDNVVNVRNKKELFFLDFVYGKDEMDEIIKNNTKVTAIDHHKSVKDVVENMQNHIYSDSHSAAVLSWQYFHEIKPLPNLFSYIEGYDYWDFSLPFSKEVAAALDLRDFDFKTWDKFIKDFENKEKKKKIIEEGKIALRCKQKVVERIADKAKRGRFEGHDVYISNSVAFHSEVGNELVKKGVSVAIIWNDQGNGASVSLRSDGKVDVSELAAKYGGGGHKAASGFGLKAGQKFPWIYDNE